MHSGVCIDNQAIHFSSATNGQKSFRMKGFLCYLFIRMGDYAL